MNGINSSSLLSLGLIMMMLCTGYSTCAYSITSKDSPSIFEEELRFICSDSNGINEEKYQRYLQMFEKQMDSSKDIEVETIVYNNSFKSPLLIDSINVDGGLMDSAWPMKCHDNYHTGRSPYSTADNNGDELWTYETDHWIEGSPTIGSDGTIYFGGAYDTLIALYPNGTLKWRFETDGIIQGSSPAIGSDGTIYFGSWDHYLYAINTNGTLKWRSCVGDNIVSSPAIADDGTIYVGTMGFPDYNGCKIYAIKSDGRIKWYYQTGYKITCDPAIGDDGTIYIGSGDTYFYALKPNGQLKWRFKTGNYIKGPASIADDGTIYVGSWDDYLYALNPDGTMLWKSKVGHGTETNPSIGPDGTIYVGGDYLWAINPVDGSKKWTFDLGSNQHIHQSSPAVSSDGTIFVGTNIGTSSGGDIIAINANGKELWRHRIANEWVQSSPSIGENGIVYIGSSSIDDDHSYGILYAYGENTGSNPPNTPTIYGNATGKTGETYAYTISTTDPDNDNIYYYISWGDLSNSGWQGPYTSGSEITVSHSWSFEGSFTIRAKAKDTYGEESNWATLEVSMPKNKGIQQFHIIEQLLQRFLVLKYLL